MITNPGLFDTGPRTRQGPAKYGEPSFPYLNESARPSFTAVRDLLDSWFAVYPGKQGSELRRRFRSSNDRQHHGAFFELYVHALLTRIGFDARPNPDVPGIRSHPDYLLERSGRRLAYLECTVANASGEDSGAEARKERIHRVLSKVIHPNFIIGVCVDLVPRRDVSEDLLIRPVADWLDTVDPDALHAADVLLPRAWKELTGPDWKVTVEAIPRRPEMRGIPLESGVGMLGPYGGWISPTEPLRSALRAKAKQFSRLDLPLIVAISCADYHVERHDITSALFGSPQLTIQLHSDGSERSHEGRAPNGAWWRGRAAGRRVSAALFVRQLVPWTVRRAEPVLWIHPWSESPFPSEEWPLAACVPNYELDRMEERTSRLRPTGELFGLPAGWPGSD